MTIKVIHYDNTQEVTYTSVSVTSRPYQTSGYSDDIVTEVGDTGELYLIETTDDNEEVIVAIFPAGVWRQVIRE